MAGKNQHVVRREDGWAVLGAGNSRDTARYGTQWIDALFEHVPPYDAGHVIATIEEEGDA